MSNYFAKLPLIVEINPSWSNEKRLCTEICILKKYQESMDRLKGRDPQ